MEPINLNKILREIEINYINIALDRADNNVTKAAIILGMKRTALWMRLRGLDIVPKTEKNRRFSPKTEKTNKLHPNLARSDNDLEGTL